MWGKYNCERYINSSPNNIKLSEKLLQGLNDKKFQKYLDLGLKILFWSLTILRDLGETSIKFSALFSPESTSLNKELPGIFKDTNITYSKTYDLFSSIIKILQGASINIIKYNERLKDLKKDTTFLNDIIKLSFDGNFATFENKCDELIDKELDDYSADSVVTLFCTLNDILHDLLKFNILDKYIKYFSPYKDDTLNYEKFIEDSIKNYPLEISSEQALSLIKKNIDSMLIEYNKLASNINNNYRKTNITEYLAGNNAQYNAAATNNDKFNMIYTILIHNINASKLIPNEIILKNTSASRQVIKRIEKNNIITYKMIITQKHKQNYEKIGSQNMRKRIQKIYMDASFDKNVKIGLTKFYEKSNIKEMETILNFQYERIKAELIPAVRAIQNPQFNLNVIITDINNDVLKIKNISDYSGSDIEFITNCIGSGEIKLNEKNRKTSKIIETLNAIMFGFYQIPNINNIGGAGNKLQNYNNIIDNRQKLNRIEINNVLNLIKTYADKISRAHEVINKSNPILIKYQGLLLTIDGFMLQYNYNNNNAWLIFYNIMNIDHRGLITNQIYGIPEITQRGNVNFNTLTFGNAKFLINKKINSLKNTNKINNGTIKINEQKIEDTLKRIKKNHFNEYLIIMKYYVTSESETINIPPAITPTSKISDPNLIWKVYNYYMTVEKFIKSPEQAKDKVNELFKSIEDENLQEKQIENNLRKEFKKLYSKSEDKFVKNVKLTSTLTFIWSLWPTLKNIFGIFIPKKHILSIFNKSELTIYMDEVIGLFAGVILGPKYLSKKSLGKIELIKEYADTIYTSETLEEKLDPIVDEMIVTSLKKTMVRKDDEEEDPYSVFVDHDKKSLIDELQRLDIEKGVKGGGSDPVKRYVGKYNESDRKKIINYAENIKKIGKKQNEIIKNDKPFKEKLKNNALTRGTYFGMINGKMIKNNITTTYKDKLFILFCQLSNNTNLISEISIAILTQILALVYMLNRLTTIVFDRYTEYKTTSKKTMKSINDICSFVSNKNNLTRHYAHKAKYAEYDSNPLEQIKKDNKEKK
jgi:hypothetical protein